MEPRGIIIRIKEGHEIILGLPFTLASRICNDDEQRLQRPFDAIEVSVIEKGFQFVLAIDDGQPSPKIIYAPDHFDHFIADTCELEGTTRAAIYGLNSSDAATLLRAFSDWLNHKQAEEFEREIKAGNLTFDEARKIRKEVFDVPSFKDFFAHSFKTDTMPKGKPGKRTVHRQNVIELYALACRIYVENPGIRWSSYYKKGTACHEAVKLRPDLVPRNWGGDDISKGDRLRREAERTLDKGPHSQLTYRKSRGRIS
ncbi:hypothetical protein SAMN05216296_1471 [Pseudomonas pohangensis]|uniref:Uncharacterized protein n=1 Tax=Pseudomonas pohangensis TaxID=364197 RepID=A0A1H2FBM1_9PSED|nr:hypothetical protein [Pseudomonas pohangensis]SDU04742.1 hypothetical protein SAMN05216296_1471 [Pseudomonas pohangensis]